MTTYSSEEALEASIKYFNGDELAANVFLSKYALRNEQDELLESTPDQMHDRLAKEFYRIEKNRWPNDAGEIDCVEDLKDFNRPLSKRFIRELFDHFKYIVPQGSPMYGIGNNYTIQSLGNCFTLGEHPYDSYGGILYADQMLVQLSKRRCGVGICLDKIRPKGLNVRNAARSTDGIGIFMERFSNSTREVAQSGRRGALLLGLSVHHPEIETFITAKQDLTKVTGANISVLITDEFMKAVQNNKDYEQRWPIDTESPEISKTQSAKKIWDLLVKCAHATADPGLQFIDTARKLGTSHQYGKKDHNFYDHVSNPCQPKWARVLTKNGISTIENIKIGEEIWSKEGWTKVIKKYSTGKKDVYKYETNAGIFYGTKNHKLVIDTKNTKKEARHCSEVHIVVGKIPDKVDIVPEYVMDGLMIGDGGPHKASNNLMGLYIGKNDKDYFNSEIKNLIIRHRPGIKDTFYEVKTNIEYSDHKKYIWKEIPKRYLNKNSSEICSLLRGLYSANGSVCGNRITYKSVSINLIRQIQFLLSSVGIRSYITENPSKQNKFKNGIYQCTKSYDLNITSDREHFIKNIGFIQDYKNKKIVLKNQNRVKEIYKITNVEKISNEPVFDLTVDNNSHTYWTDGIDASNCGEIIMGKDSCRLMLLNLFSYVIDPFTDKAKFDYKLFKQHSVIAQRLMDAMVDLEIEKIETIINKIKSDPEPDEIKKNELDMWLDFQDTAKKGRRTGLGITALGDCLAAQNIEYGSTDSINSTRKIYKTLCMGSLKGSCQLAQYLKPFPLYSSQLEENHQWLNKILSENKEIAELHSKYGRRNVSLTTTAPAGTVSIMTQTTSGIEPAFLLEYTRRRKIQKDAVEYDYVDDLGDKWEHYKVYHHKYKMWQDLNPRKKISPYDNSTANNIDWEKSVDIQAAAQEYVTHSISKTINVPESTSVELIDKLYRRAYEKNLKGVTVYRDGCRSGVLVADKQLSKIDRPKELQCDIHHTTKDKTKYAVLVGLENGFPYEIFGFTNRKAISDKYKKGKIIKVRKSKYKLEFDDDSLYPITSFMTEEEEMLSRTYSLMLRNGIAIEEICKQLHKTEGNLGSFSKAMEKVLSNYADGKETGEICPECSGKIIYTGGCKMCGGPDGKDAGAGCGHSVC